MRYNIVSNIIGSNLRYISIIMLAPVVFYILYR